MFSKQLMINVEQNIKVQERKNTWKMRKIILFSLSFIIMLGLFIGATETGPPQSIIYENTKYNFTLTLPNSWGGKYEVVDKVIQSADQENIDFINKANKGYGGVLFTISIWSKADAEDAAKHIQVSTLGEKGDKIISLTTPSDVEFSLEDAKLKAEYQSMWNDIAFIKTTFEIKPSLDIGGPRALGKSLFGELQIEPQSKENIHKLGAPSCYGLEDDNSITADYNV